MMKHLKLILILFLSLVSCSKIFSQYIRGGDTAYVWAMSGLILREGPSKDSERIGNLPYGTAVLIKERMPERGGSHEEVVDAGSTYLGTKGKVEYKIRMDYFYVNTGGQEGYVYGGYISKLKPVDAYTGYLSKSSFFIKYLNETGQFGKELCRSEYTVGNSEFYYLKIVWEKGASVTVYGHEGPGTHCQVELPFFHLHDGYLLASAIHNRAMESLRKRWGELRPEQQELWLKDTDSFKSLSYMYEDEQACSEAGLDIRFIPQTLILNYFEACD